MALGLVSGGVSELAGEASTSINTLCFEKLREPRIWGWKLILRSLLLIRRLESLGISLRDNGNVSYVIKTCLPGKISIILYGYPYCGRLFAGWQICLTASSDVLFSLIIRTWKRFAQFFPVRKILSPSASYAMPFRTPGRRVPRSKLFESPLKLIQPTTLIRRTQSRSKTLAQISPLTVSSSFANLIFVLPSRIVFECSNLSAPSSFVFGWMKCNSVLESLTTSESSTTEMPQPSESGV